jgi:uncharacterized membrane protein YkoI
MWFVGRLRLWLLLPLAALLTQGPGTAPLPAIADDRGGEHDHERARRAVERGEILPLDTVLTAVRATIAGEIVDIELEREHGRWIYEVKVIDRAGRLVEVYADAATATVVKIEDD